MQTKFDPYETKKELHSRNIKKKKKVCEGLGDKEWTNIILILCIFLLIN